MFKCNSGIIVPVTVKKLCKAKPNAICIATRIAQEHVQLPTNHIVTVIKYQGYSFLLSLHINYLIVLKGIVAHVKCCDFIHRNTHFTKNKPCGKTDLYGSFC